MTAFTISCCAQAEKQASIVDMKSSLGNEWSQVEKPDFGPYKFERSLTSVPSSIVKADEVIARNGSMSFVTVQPNEVIGKGNVVKNLLTGDFTMVTGNIILLLKDEVSASEIAEASGLQIVSVFPGTNIAVFSVPEGADLLNAFQSLKSFEGVLESKIEVAENMFESN